MKKIITLTLLVALSLSSIAQDTTPVNPVKKGDYKILKLDALNLIGIGIQKLRLDYEISPMKANQNSGGGFISGNGMQFHSPQVNVQNVAAHSASNQMMLNLKVPQMQLT